MNLFTSKGMLLYSTILLISSVILFAQNAEPLYISTDLNNPIQRIGTIIFAPPAADNGGWQATGQVPMSAENEKVTIEGSLLTNGTQNNVIQTPTPKNVSILGGKGNIMLATRESTLIGGSGNKTIASQSFIGGGESNVITGNYSRNAVILGGKGNTIIGGASIILGGERNTISGNNSVTLGNNISITGDTSLAAGSGVQLEAAQSFVWNEGTKKFSVTGNNVFALNATRGMIVNTPTPHLQATLTLNGDLRVQTGGDPTCSSTIAGTMKNISWSGDRVCSCVCDGTGWQSVVTTEVCKKNCLGDGYIYPVNGACGNAHGSNVNSAPVSNLCSAGTPSTVRENRLGGTWTWTCAGSNGGSTATCQASKIALAIDGICGSAHGENHSSVPSNDLCAAGTASAVEGNGPWTWSCVGNNGGTVASCSANIDGCRSSTDCSGRFQVCRGYYAAGMACIPYGGFDPVTTYGYTCQEWREDESPLESCNDDINSQGRPVGQGCKLNDTEIFGQCSDNFILIGEDGVCGTANGTIRTTAPSTIAETCSAGTASSVINESGQWTWTCAGLNGGRTATCSANIRCKSNADCGNGKTCIGYTPASGSCFTRPTITSPFAMRPTLILPKQYVARDILSLFVPTVIALSQELIETSIDDNEPILECFIAGTKILMADGTEKNIEEVQIGEKLLGANGSTNTVLAYQRPILENDVLYSINDKNYFVTASHPFMTTEGWKSINPAATHQEMPSFDVAPLQIGDVLITSQGNTTITSLSTSVPMAQVQLYNFVVDGNHTYYANNYLVHNKTMTTVCNYTTSSACNNDTSCMWLATIEVMGTCQ